MQVAAALNGFHLLPGRFGPRPRSSAKLPFRQLEQFPPADIQERLLELSLNLPFIHTRQSRMASAQCRALCVSDTMAGGPPEAFIDGHEFCHIHPLPEGCIHLTLPGTVIERVVALGWAERHPVHGLGLLKSLVMVYAPRNADELDVVAKLIESSRLFATGSSTGTILAARSVS